MRVHYVITYYSFTCLFKKYKFLIVEMQVNNEMPLLNNCSMVMIKNTYTIVK